MLSHRVSPPPEDTKQDEFVKEVQALKSLHHPKLIQLLAMCSRGEPVYIVTELMSRGSLKSYLNCERGGGRVCVCVFVGGGVDDAHLLLSLHSVGGPGAEIGPPHLHGQPDRGGDGLPGGQEHRPQGPGSPERPGGGGPGLQGGRLRSGSHHQGEPGEEGRWVSFRYPPYLIWVSSIIFTVRLSCRNPNTPQAQHYIK